jgi:hypothetical protein
MSELLPAYLKLISSKDPLTIVKRFLKAKSILENLERTLHSLDKKHQRLLSTHQLKISIVK